jgi:hypothetical protein
MNSNNATASKHLANSLMKPSMFGIFPALNPPHSKVFTRVRLMYRFFLRSASVSRGPASVNDNILDFYSKASSPSITGERCKDV